MSPEAKVCIFTYICVLIKINEHGYKYFSYAGFFY